MCAMLERNKLIVRKTLQLHVKYQTLQLLLLKNPTMSNREEILNSTVKFRVNRLPIVVISNTFSFFDIVAQQPSQLSTSCFPNKLFNYFKPDSAQ